MYVCSGRRPWFNKFRAALGRCDTVDAIEKLLRVKVQRWRGLPPLSHEDTDDEDAQESDIDEGGGRPPPRGYGESTRAADMDDLLADLSILST